VKWARESCARAGCQEGRYGRARVCRAPGWVDVGAKPIKACCGVRDPLCCGAPSSAPRTTAPDAASERRGCACRWPCDGASLRPRSGKLEAGARSMGDGRASTLGGAHATWLFLADLCRDWARRGVGSLACPSKGRSATLSSLSGSCSCSGSCITRALVPSASSSKTQPPQ
jgi:hypothetical protein